MRRLWRWIIKKLFQGEYFSRDEVNHFLKYDYSFQMLTDSQNYENIVHAHVPIRFRDDLELGVTQSKIVSVLGKPKYKYNNKVIKGHTILFYKKIIKGYKSNLVLHLYKDSFFLGMYLIRAEKSEIKEILSKVMNTYLIGNDVKLIPSDIIEDSLGNFIKIEDYKYLALGYFDKRNAHYDEIASLILANKDIRNMSVA